AGFADVFAAADAVPSILAHRPAGLEGFDAGLVDDTRRAGLHPEGIALLPEGGGWLLAEMGGATAAEAEERARRLEADLSRRRPAPSTRLLVDARQMRRVWQVRESALPATARPPGRPLTWEGWEDSAVAPEKLGAFLRDQRRLWERHGFRGDLYGHFGDGCVHTRLDFDFETSEGVRRFRDYVEEAADLVLSYGGSLSGEHGDGQSRGELLPKMFGPELVEAFREFKRIWDPEGRMNPGKLVDARPIVEGLRIGGGRPGRGEATIFRFPEDGGDFSRVALRCVGVGKCLSRAGGTMCPSFRATGEEGHSTRGRARLLFEMLRGDPLPGAWSSDAVKEALDLCLGCKACKTECPVAVDMASYKAEFLAHYFRGRRRPRASRIFGRVHAWAALAARAPALANFLTQAPGLSRLAKAAAGIAPERSIPRLARRTFRRWFSTRTAARRAGGPRVLLWPDTFTNFFQPEIGRAAVEVLESAGFAVEIPASDLCCGRPLYDFGGLSAAQHLLRGIFAALEAPLASGVPIVVLEPSCASVFLDEAPNLFPESEPARRLSRQTFPLAKFLEAHAPESARPRLAGPVLVQPHCHERALLGTGDLERRLARGDAAARILDAGCCGMAGAFGLERGRKFRVSVACAEQVLLPEIRASAPETLILADGFSCREQIRQLSGRRARHLAEALAAGIARTGGFAPPDP
ncbi:MAG TPA: FAD-linked oxidase C-terminal domain-containing protein, partial [Thermoanaerobaculia bacterium]